MFLTVNIQVAQSLAPVIKVVFTDIKAWPGSFAVIRVVKGSPVYVIDATEGLLIFHSIVSQLDVAVNHAINVRVSPTFNSIVSGIRCIIILPVAVHRKAHVFVRIGPATTPPRLLTLVQWYLQVMYCTPEKARLIPTRAYSSFGFSAKTILGAWSLLHNATSPYPVYGYSGAGT